MSLVLEISDLERKIIEVLHEQDGYQKATAIILGYTPCSISKRLGLIKKRTGLDPRIKEDRIELLTNTPVGTGYLLTTREKEIILVSCECNMNLTEVSRRLYMHPNGMSYYRNSIINKTGLNIRKFDDLIKLRKMVRGE